MIITLVGAGAAEIREVPAIFKGDPGTGGSGGASTWGNITGKPTTFTPSAHTHTWTEVTGKPTTFTPSAHTHTISEITSLQTTLDAKAATGHSHTVANITGLQTALDGKQPTTTFKTVNGQVITGTGNIVTAETFTTDSAAAAYSTSNPGVVVFSSQA